MQSKRISAGLMMYRIREGKLEVFIIHPGGPFFKNKEEGWWSIPKGEPKVGEELLETAKREFNEETGIEIKTERFIELGSVKQKSGKEVFAWAFEGDWMGLLMCKSYVTMEFPVGSGKKIKFPEVDKGRFFDVVQARKLLNEAQREFIDRLISKIV